MSKSTRTRHRPSRSSRRGRGPSPSVPASIASTCGTGRRRAGRWARPAWRCRRSRRVPAENPCPFHPRPGSASPSRCGGHNRRRQLRSTSAADSRAATLHLARVGVFVRSYCHSLIHPHLAAPVRRAQVGSLPAPSACVRCLTAMHDHIPKTIARAEGCRPPLVPVELSPRSGTRIRPTRS